MDVRVRMVVRFVRLPLLFTSRRSLLPSQTVTALVLNKREVQLETSRRSFAGIQRSRPGNRETLLG